MIKNLVSPVKGSRKQIVFGSFFCLSSARAGVKVFVQVLDVL